MRAVVHFTWIGCLLIALMLPNTSSAQLSVGIGAGLDFDTDATLAGLQLRMPVMGATVGMTFDFGEGETRDVGLENSDILIDFEVLRLTVPIGYAFALNEFGEFTIEPFVAPGWYSWKLDALGAAAETEVSVELGVEVRYNIMFANGFVGVRKGELDILPKYGFRLGFLFTLGE